MHGIAIKDNDLLIGTHGRSFYAMENISVLRQEKPELTTAAVHLFAPPTAVRRVQQAASIDYYLKSAAEKVTIQIVDSSGREVRSFASVPEKKEDKDKDKDKKDDTAAAADDDEEGGGPPGGRVPKVTTKAGMNRFNWDMRYAGARDFPKMILWAGNVRGPIALPGTYQVKLTVNGGDPQTQPLTIAKDPRQPQISDADLQQQFTLAMQIRDKVTQADEAVLRIRHLKEQATDRAEHAKDAKLTAAVDAFSTKLTTIEGEIYQYRNQSNQDPLNFPIKLNNKLATLQNIVESADGKPTKQSGDVFADLSAQLDTQLQALDARVKADLPPLNKLVTSRKLAAIKDEVPPPSATAAPSTTSAGDEEDTDTDEDEHERVWQ